jgi:hypothetical protein
MMMMRSDIHAHYEVTVRTRHWENSVLKMTGLLSEPWNVFENYVIPFIWSLPTEAATFCRSARIKFKMKLCNTLIGLSTRFVSLSPV